MPDPRITNLARVIVDFSVGVKPGDQVALRTHPAAAPLMQEVYRLALQRGAHIEPQIRLPGLKPIYFEHANDDQIQYVSPVEKLVLESFDVLISIMAEVNTRELNGVDPNRQAAKESAEKELTKTFMERSASGSLRWNLSLFPTDSYAQDADMSLAAFEDFVYAACLCDQPDAVAAWKEVQRKQQTLVDWLAGKHEVHLAGPDTDLTVGISGRPFINCYGDKNMPDGEIFTGPEETKVNGHVRFSFPAVDYGREVEDVRLWFEDGKVVQWSAAKNEAFLTEMLNTDEGARRLGEFAFGTNYGIQRFVKNILFDEKIGGTVHMALGAGYPESGSSNESAIHWDLICDLRAGGEVTVDGELFAKDGKYLPWR
jgi:aminopeptidase